LTFHALPPPANGFDRGARGIPGSVEVVEEWRRGRDNRIGHAVDELLRRVDREA
jgi:hypothetical protein